jgi:hypothetical protein
MSYIENHGDVTIVVDLPHATARAAFDTLMDADLSPVYIETQGNLIGLGPLVDTLAVAVPHDQVEEAREVLHTATIDAKDHVARLGRKVIAQAFVRSLIVISCGIVLIIALMGLIYVLNSLLPIIEWGVYVTIGAAIALQIGVLRFLYTWQKEPRDEEDEDEDYGLDFIDEED